MNSSIGTVILFTAVTISIIMLAHGVLSAQPRDGTVHDPVMIKQDDTYYIFHTGQEISVKSSDDMELPHVFIDREWNIMENGATVEGSFQYTTEKGIKPLTSCDPI